MERAREDRNQNQAKKSGLKTRARENGIKKRARGDEIKKRSLQTREGRNGTGGWVGGWVLIWHGETDVIIQAGRNNAL